MYRFLFYSIIISSISFAQSTTFERFYENYTHCLSVEQDYSGNYIAAAGNAVQCLAVKMNPEGRILWEGPKFYFDINLKVFARKLPEDNYIFAYTDSDGVFYLQKLNNSGIQLWQKNISGYSIGEITATITGEIYIAAEKRADKKIYLFKYSSSGEMLWVKEYTPAYATLLLKAPDLAIHNTLIFLSGYKVIYKLDLDGNVLSEIPAAHNVWEITLSQDYLYVTRGGNKLEKFTFAGNMIWSVSQLCGDMVYVAASNSVAGSAYGSINLISSDGLVTQTLSDLGTLKTIAPLPDGIIAGGSYISQMYFLKTDQNLNCSGIAIKGPAENSLVGMAEPFQINFHKRNLNNFNIEYSTDNGSNWTVLLTGVSSDSSVECTIPIVQPGNIAIKLVSGLTSSFEKNFRIGYLGSGDYINVNNVKMWVTQNGRGSFNPYTGTSGFYWPDNIKTAVYTDGLVFGGKINQQVRFNGNTHRDGLIPGIILSNGLPDDRYLLKYGVWKIKNDWQNLPPGMEKQKYEYAYNNWPVDIGAPFKDINHDNIYTPGIDIPGFGDETVFYASHDLDTTAALNHYGSLPLGLQFYTTVFGFNEEPLNDVVFKKYFIVNKGSNYIEDLYFGYWGDPDLGYGSDDYAGVDSSLNLAYCYNAAQNDPMYGMPCPAVGHKLIQGPMVPGSSSDSAMFAGQWVPGFKNLNSTSFINIKNSTSVEFRDPVSGYQGTLEFYNYLKGLKRDGSPIINPHTDEPVKFMTGGDPISYQGWFDGIGWPGGPGQGDKRYLLSAGPINLAPGEYQEVVVMIAVAVGTTTLNSIEALKQKTTLAEQHYKNQYVVSGVNGDPGVPSEYLLDQNYPNPFNSSTIINFSIPAKSFINLSIYDITGQRLQTIVNKEMPAGKHKVHFNKSSLSSGVYFYKLMVNDKSFIKKMILLK